MSRLSHRISRAEILAGMHRRALHVVKGSSDAELNRLAGALCVSGARARTTAS